MNDYFHPESVINVNDDNSDVNSIGYIFDSFEELMSGLDNPFHSFDDSNLGLPLFSNKGGDRSHACPNRHKPIDDPWAPKRYLDDCSEPKLPIIAPKNIRKSGPVKRPLDEHSLLLPHYDRSQATTGTTTSRKMSSFTDPIDVLLQPELCSSQHNMRAHSQRANHDYHADHAASTYPSMNNDNVDHENASLYEHVHTYKKLAYLPITSTTDTAVPDMHQPHPVQQQKKPKRFEFPEPRWYWHDAAEPIAIPPTRCVTVNDSNGNPQKYKLFYAAVTMPFHLANRYDIRSLYAATREAVQSSYSSNHSL